MQSTRSMHSKYIYILSQWCMYIKMCIYIYIHTHCVYYIYIRTVCVHIYIYTVCVCVFKYIYIQCVFICIYIYIAYIHIQCVYIYIHTDTDKINHFRNSDITPSLSARVGDSLRTTRFGSLRTTRSLRTKKHHLEPLNSDHQNHQSRC